MRIFTMIGLGLAAFGLLAGKVSAANEQRLVWIGAGLAAVDLVVRGGVAAKLKRLVK